MIRAGVKLFKIIVLTIISPVIKYQFVLKSEYIPLTRIGMPWDFKLAYDKRIITPVFKNVQKNTPVVI